MRGERLWLFEVAQMSGARDDGQRPLLARRE
jgi:hypothetical protein